MTVANMEATAVPRVRGLRPLAGLFSPVCRRAPPPARGARAGALGAGETGKTPQIRNRLQTPHYDAGSNALSMRRVAL